VHINIKNIVKNNAAWFSFHRAGHMYYEVAVEGQLCRFPGYAQARPSTQSLCIR
jgi:hypothetical protein